MFHKREDEHLEKFAIRTSTAVQCTREFIQRTPSCAPCYTRINLQSHFPCCKDSGDHWSCQSQQNNLSSSLSDCKGKRNCFGGTQGAWRSLQWPGISGIAISWQKWAHKGCLWFAGSCPLQREPLSARRHPAEKGTATNLEFHLKKGRNFTKKVNFIDFKISASWGKSLEEVKLQIETYNLLLKAKAAQSISYGEKKNQAVKPCISWGAVSSISYGSAWRIHLPLNTSWLRNHWDQIILGRVISLCSNRSAPSHQSPALPAEYQGLHQQKQNWTRAKALSNTNFTFLNMVFYCYLVLWQENWFIPS